jgi:hypothetical protein
MPSLISSDLTITGGTSQATTNYLKMTPQHTYGVGQVYSNFGTRQLRLLQITAVTGASGSTSAVDFSVNYQSSASKFSLAVRALQTGAEIYQIWVPGTSGFLVAVSEDTINDSDSSSNVAGGPVSATTYTDLEAAITAAVATGTGAATTITALTVGSTGIALTSVA